MFDYLISAANVLGLTACFYIAYLFIVAARSRSPTRQNGVKVMRESVSCELQVASAQPDYYYAM
ncbi:MAG: hypothetical protein ABIS45_16325 [Burkholderiales bacterium]